MFKLDQVKASFRITKRLMFVITLLNVHTCKCRHIYSVKGQSALLNFPFPCDSTEVTLQQSNRQPFYRSTDGFALSLPKNQANRFKVQTSIENENCSMDLTISNLTAMDQGTYLSTIYMDGQLLDHLTTRVYLGVDNPHNKASCVEVQDKGGDWVAIDCTINIESLAEKIECYQNGQRIPPRTDPVLNHISMIESFLIRKSQPAFCCSSTSDEDKERCDCDDAALNLVYGDSNDPCPPSSMVTTRPLISIVTEKNQVNSTGMSSTPMNLKECKSDKCVIIHSVFFPIEVLLILLSIFVYYKMKTKTTSSKSDHTEKVAMRDCEDDESVTNSFVEIQLNQSSPGRQ